MKQKILDTISDLCSNFLYYDRKEDEELSAAQLNEAVKSGEITIDEMVNAFRQHLEQTIFRKLIKKEYRTMEKEERIKELESKQLTPNDSLPMDFVLWYSGMTKAQILNAYQRFLNEILPKPPQQ